MKNQRELFQLPEDIHFLNCAYMSPLLRKVEEAGIESMQLKRNPSLIKSIDFFTQTEIIKHKFAELVNAPSYQQVAIINAASYGVATAIRNTPDHKRRKAVTIGDEFPSTVYSLRRWCKTHQATLTTVDAPKERLNKGQIWNDKIIAALDSDTAILAMSAVHWADGTKFDLEAIGARCRELGVMFIIDGTQSVGALPIDVQKFKTDALVTASYKWLMGPYGSGVAFYSEAFNEGIPLEESWLNRANAKNFSTLTNYTDEYMPGAARYNMGEFSSFIHLPMLDKALEQLLAWNPANVQNYCKELSQPLFTFLDDNGFGIETKQWRADHLFGFYLPERLDKNQLLENLTERKVHVSLRGDAIRVSPHVYNTKEDVQALIGCLKDNL